MTKNSDIRGSYNVEKEDWGTKRGSTTCLDEGEAVYVRFEMRLEYLVV
jgi:hypothetical protein